jgi:hypothetical protein
LLEGLTLDDAEAKIEGDSLCLRGSGDARRLRMRLGHISSGGRDLVVALRVRGERMDHYPDEGLRLVYLTAMQDGRPAIEWSRPWGTRVRRHAYFLDDDFLNVFSYNDLPGGEIDLQFEFEGRAPVWIDELQVVAAPDTCYREFENGTVLVNPAKAPFTFDLAGLFPGRRFRRLKGRPGQCPEINNGEPVGDSITLPAHDALFLAQL